MRRLLFLFVLSSLFALPSLVFAETWDLTIDQAVERAVVENRDLSVAREKLVELAGKKGEAMSTGLPQLTGLASYQRNHRKPKMLINGQSFNIGSTNTYNSAADLTQLLWDGGKVIKAVKAAKSEESKGQQDILATKNNVIYATKSTYFNILYVDKIIGVYKRQIATLKYHLTAIKERFNRGLDSDYTLMRQDVEVSNIEPYLIDAERQREQLVNQLKVLLAIPQQDQINLKSGLSYAGRQIPSTESLVEMAVEKRPELLAEKFRQKSLEQNVGIEKAGYYPILSAEVKFQWQGFSDDWKVGSDERTDSLFSTVNLSWPIIDGFKTASRVKQARSQLKQQTSLTSQLEDNVIKDVKNAQIALVKARESYRSQSKALSLAKRATEIAGERFSSGLMNQVELLDTITAQSEAEQQYYGAIYECIVSEAALEAAVGGEL